MFSGGQPGTSMPRCSPIWASTSLISFSDLRPKFGVRSISASDFWTVTLGGDIALAGGNSEFHADFRALVEGADLQVGIEHHDVADGLDVTGGDDTRTGLLDDHALGAFALHLDRDVLDVEHDVG